MFGRERAERPIENNAFGVFDPDTDTDPDPDEIKLTRCAGVFPSSTGTCR